MTQNSANDDAQWIPGVMLADAIGERPDVVVKDAVGTDVWAKVREFGRRYGVDISGETTFDELDALPAEVGLLCGAEFSRHEVVAFIEDGYECPLPDPDDVGERLKAARTRRFQSHNAATRALKAERVQPGTQYTLAEIHRACDDQAAADAEHLVDRANIRAWAAVRPHSQPEHTSLISAAELVSLGVPVSTIAEMSAATANEKDAAVLDLAVARKRFADGVIRKARTGGQAREAVCDRTLSVEDLAGLAPPTSLIDGLLFVGEASELIGPPGSYKSFTAVDMACASATGESFAARHKVPGGAVPVVYVAGEGVAGMHSRITAWCRHRNVDPAKLDGMLHVVSGPVQLGDPDDMAGLTELVQRVGAKLVIFDTRARCTVGLEENSATDQGVAIAAVDKMIADTGSAALLVHHTALAAPDRGRGTSAWLGAVYSSLVQSIDGEGRIEIRCAKHKDAPDGCKHYFAIETVQINGGRDSLVIADFDPLTVTGGGSTVHDDIWAIVDDIADTGGVTAAMVAAAAIERKICGKTATYSAIKVLARMGRLDNVGTQKRPRHVAVDLTRPE